MLAGPVPVTLFRLAAPNVIAVLAQTGSTFADAWYVGHLGTAALASLALVFPYQTLMIMMAGGAIGGGTTSSVSRALGRHDAPGAGNAARHAVLICLALGLAFTVVLAIFARPVFSLMGAEGDALNGAVQYARIAFGGALAVCLSWILAAILRGAGDTVTPARAIVLASLSQIVLSGVLTLGVGSFAGIGIAGPAVAFVVCQGGAGVYMAVRLLQADAPVALRPGKISWPPVADIMRVGGLGLFNSASIALTVVLVTGFVGRYGTAALAGYGLGSRLELMLVPFAFGVGGALTATVGANFGAAQFSRARRFAWTGAGAIFLITLFIGLVLTVAPGLWLGLFTTDEQAWQYGASYLATVGPFYALFAAGQTLYFASQGTGRMLLPVSVGLLRLVVVASLGLLIIRYGWPVSYLFGAVAVGLSVVGIGLALCMRSRAWRPDAGSR